MSRRVLVVDDEERMRGLLTLHLRQAFAVETAASGEEALQILRRDSFDLVVLDVLMPGLDGWEVCRRIRRLSLSLPILMLTALSNVEDKLEAFGAGADDYVTKPFDPRELVARAEALIRRVDGPDKASETTAPKLRRLEFPGMIIDTSSRVVRVQGTPVTLTPKEFDLLVHLAGAPGQVFSRERLLQGVWGDSVFVETRTIDSHVKTLREKLGRDGIGRSLVTVWGVGYKFEPPGGSR